MEATYNKEIFVKDYFDIHNHYVKTFGSSTLILMQVGSFHEAYNTDNEGPDLFYLGERINMTVTQKNKSKPLSTSNPRMMGFPSYIVEDMVERIVNLGYTIIRIDQTSEPPNPKREVVGIFSPSTLLNSTNNSKNIFTNNNLVCIIFDALKLKTPNPILCIGISAYDISSGIGCCYETVSTNYDTMLALDNTIRFLEKYLPTETIYHFSSGILNHINNNGNINRMNTEDIIKYLGINTQSGIIYKLSNSELVLNAKYQTETLQKVFNNNLDSINLHAYNYARTSLVGLLEFTKNHQPILLNKLTEPTYYDNEETLYLGNHALEQLDVLSNNPGLKQSKTLYDIICNCHTPMGKRFLIDQLCNPLINPNKLNERYNIISILMTNNIYINISKEMHNIYDLPKIIRKMELNKVYPFEIVYLYNSIEQINKVFKIMRNINDEDRKIIKKTVGIDKDICDKLKEVNNYIKNTFNLEYITNLSFANYKEEKQSFIINNKYDKLKELEDDIEVCTNFMENLVSTLEKFVEEQNNKVIKKDCNSITLKNNDRDGHYMIITKRRCKILQEKLNKMSTFKVGNIDINVSDLEFKDLPANNNTKITCNKITEYSNKVGELKIKLANEIKIAFYEEINIIIDNYKETISNASNIIKLLDFLNSGAICATELGYCKPNININNAMHIDSYFDAKELRHPIIEVINTDTAYHPHNISLGKPDSVLLFGVNSSGKSSLMKSIGLAIILAQIGYYVPAKEFNYNPYKNLFTRIRGNDDLYKGLSSFMLEMVELGAILKRNNNKTLVLADELAKGTEYKSSLIIISYMLETLQKSNTSFISASHLHSLCDLPCIKNLNNVKIMHIKVSFDEVNNELIYDRQLSEGEGEHFYGLLVCKYFMKSDDFNTRTKEIEAEVESQHIKKSNYNNNVFMICCEICGNKKNLESHHIEPQKDCDKFKSIKNPHIKKNESYNLVILCSKCHDMHDRGDINIIGWQETSNKRKLNYKVNN